MEKELPVVQFNEDFIIRVWFHPHQWIMDGTKITKRLEVSDLDHVIKYEAKGYTLEVTVNVTKVGYLLGILYN